jgi:FKBP-type peptidyl-prolyl cis-trans isomerase FkpA
MTRPTWKWVAVLVCTMAFAPACKPKIDSQAVQAGPKALSTDDEKAVYAIGVMLGKNVKPLQLNAAEIEILQRALGDSVAGRKLEVNPETEGDKLLQPFLASRQAKAAILEKEKAKAFRETAAKETGAVVLPSGLVYRTLTEGKGATPKPTDAVRVHYKGTLTDGTEFDSSIKRGQPAEFPLTGIIPCWSEGLQKMKVGEKARLVCPAEIAYGDQGRPPTIPGGATLVFEVELLGIKGR